MRRLTAVREPQREGYDKQLFDNQYTFLQEHTEFINELQRLYFTAFDDYKGAVVEAIEHYDDVHPKRALRRQAFADLSETGDIETITWTSEVTYKMKPDEWAKPGKYPRMIGDLTCPASLRGFRATEFLKIAQSERPVFVNGGEIQFVKSPDPFAMEDVFKKLRHPPGRFYAAVFSDDSCFSVRVGDEVHMYNLDISSCDGSHGPAVFEAYRRLYPPIFEKDADALIEQCKMPISVYSVGCARDCVVLRPKTPMLYSGSTITTSINNLASMLIYYSITLGPYTGVQSIVDGAARVGYIVTAEKCEDFRDLQFLKHSPVIDELGCLRPLLNLGVLLRASGVCRGDLPGKKSESLIVRAKKFQSALLQGAYPRATFELLENMRSSCGDPNGVSSHVQQTLSLVKSEFAYKVVDNPLYPTFRVAEHELYARYRLTDLEIAEVTGDFGKSGVGSKHCTSGLSKILMKDYGLSCKPSLSPLLDLPRSVG